MILSLLILEYMLLFIHKIIVRDGELSETKVNCLVKKRDAYKHLFFYSFQNK